MAIASGLIASHGELERELEAIVETVCRSTVQVRGHEPGGGSGVIWDRSGLIITNAHVARGRSAIVELSDGRRLEGPVVERDPQRDLALVRVQANDLPAAPTTDSDELRVGQIVLAVGNPPGLVGAVTVGIIHAIAPAEGHGRHTWVQADVRLAPGNSGGPLVDASGSVIGINSMVAGGLGLAVPSNAVDHFLRLSGPRPQLGVVTQPVPIVVDGRRMPGLLVLEVVDDSAAQRGGLIVGDILIGATGHRFRSPIDLPLAIADPGLLQLELLRGGRLITRDVLLTPPDASEESGNAAA